MPFSQNVNVMLGASVFGVVCAATLYIVEHYRQDRRRHAMAKDLARLNTEFAALRKQLDTLLAQQKEKGAKRSKRSKRLESFVSTSSTAEDYASALDADSSDLEFYDVSDDEEEEKSLELDLLNIDKVLEGATTEQLLACLQQLNSLSLADPENPQLLWRLGKVHHRLFLKTEKQDHLAKGIDACNRALKINPQIANVHKWLALLIGERTQFEPMKEKILGGFEFKQHIDQAVKLNPIDPSLHYMLGRFAYDVAELKWYERKVAATLFAEPPNGTYPEALEHFLEAERLSPTPWKENKMYLARCKIKLGLIDEAVTILEEAGKVKEDDALDQRLNKEIKDLLKKYKR